MSESDRARMRTGPGDLAQRRSLAKSFSFSHVHLMKRIVSCTGSGWAVIDALGDGERIEAAWKQASIRGRH